MSAEDRPVAFVLVETGMHAGARLELREAGTWYAAGGQVDAEYWLADPDLQDARVEFAVIGGALRARLREGPALIVGTASVEPGGETTVEQTLLWGGVSFRAELMPPPPEDKAAAAAPASPPRPAPAVRIVAAVRELARNRRLLSLMGATAVLVVPAAVAMSSLSSMLERRQAQQLQREALSAQESPEVQMLRAREAAQRLSDLVGTPTVSVKALDGRTLALFGSNVPRSDQERVRNAVAQVERGFTVRDNVVYQPETPATAKTLTRLPEGVDLVQYGPRGYLKGRDGHLYLAGGVLPDGTRVDLIRDREVWLSRGTERAVLRAGETSLEPLLPQE